MVQIKSHGQGRGGNFQYSLCRVVLMVTSQGLTKTTTGTLSVLALSSRFDGRVPLSENRIRRKNFQYSLCRVVLMVTSLNRNSIHDFDFQYSLCRVVLMVPTR